MGYKENWKVLADLLTELRKKGERIPSHVMNDVRSAKTMIQILKADPTHIENIPRIETYLRTVESYVISRAQEKLGTEFAEKWLRKLEKARKTKIKEKKETTLKFVSGFPRNKKWVRVQISKDTSRKETERLAKENKLSFKMQRNGYMLVYGNGKSIKSFVKKMAEELRGTRKK